MPLVEWIDALNTGVEEIDNQHRTLVAMLNDLYDASQSQDGNAKSLEIIEAMKVYALKHFSTEEQYMNKYKYPAMMDHLAEHASFVSKVMALAGRSADPGFVPMVVKFLKQWLTEHISNVDVKMGRYLQEQM